MKIVKITMGSAYGKDEAARAAGEPAEYMKRVHDFFEGAKTVGHPGTSEPSWLVTSDRALEAFDAFGIYDFYTGGVKSIETVFDTKEEFEDQMHGMLNRMQLAASRLEAQTTALMVNDDGTGLKHSYDNPGWNAKTQSPLSGPVLHSFNQTMLLEDCCTDELQSHLADGWRMVAICPQESRRPDYVLGRYQIDPTQSALRG